MRTIGEIPRKHALLRPDHTALVDGDRRIDFAELDRRATKLANALLSLGLRSGDRVGAMMANCHQYAELPFALSRAGLILVNINERLGPREISFILRDSGCRAIVTAPAHTATLDTASVDTSQLEFRIAIGAAPGYLSYEELLSAGGDEPPRVEVREDDTAFIIYTSGTTGRPKGVQLTHRNVLSSANNFLLEAYHEVEGIYVACMPYHHVACVPNLAALLKGWTVVVTTFEPMRVLRLIQDYRATTIFLVPTMIQLLFNHPELARFDLSSLKTIFYAASPIPVVVLKRALERLGPVFVQMYGLTETSSLCTMLSKADHLVDPSSPAARRLASCGREVTHVSVRVVDEQGKDVSADEVGEIVIQGDNVLPAYWGDPDESAEALRDGWFHTGDLGRLDQDRYLYIVDRKKDLIISGGENIYPREIEEVLYAHPAVREACVIGVPNETWGESVHAAIALQPGKSVTEQELIAYCQSQLAAFKKPRSIAFVDALPKNAVGKIDKKTVRAPYWEKSQSNVV